MLSLEDSAIVEEAKQCQAQCQRPVSIFQNYLKHNVAVVQKNAQDCINTCPGNPSNGEQPTQQFVDCATDCIYISDRLVKGMDKKLSDDVLSVPFDRLIF